MCHDVAKCRSLDLRSLSLLDVYDIYRVTIRIVVIIVGRRELWEGFDSVGIVGKQLSKLRSNTCVSARKKARVGEGTTKASRS